MQNSNQTRKEKLANDPQYREETNRRWLFNSHQRKMRTYTLPKGRRFTNVRNLFSSRNRGNTATVQNANVDDTKVSALTLYTGMIRQKDEEMCSLAKEQVAGFVAIANNGNGDAGGDCEDMDTQPEVNESNAKESEAGSSKDDGSDGIDAESGRREVDRSDGRDAEEDSSAASTDTEDGQVVEFKKKKLITVTNHAFLRMYERGIFLSDIKNAIEPGQRTKKKDSEAVLYDGLIVIIDIQAEAIVIVTTWFEDKSKEQFGRKPDDSQEEDMGAFVTAGEFYQERMKFLESQVASLEKQVNSLQLELQRTAECDSYRECSEEEEEEAAYQQKQRIHKKEWDYGTPKKRGHPKEDSSFEYGTPSKRARNMFETSQKSGTPKKRGRYTEDSPSEFGSPNEWTTVTPKKRYSYNGGASFAYGTPSKRARK